HLNDLRNVGAAAIAVIEWALEETAAWVEDVNRNQLLPGETIEPTSRAPSDPDPPPQGVDAMPENIAGMARSCSPGLKGNEEDKLKADMMTRPECWVPVTVEQVRAKCRALGMRGKDVDTIADFMQRRKDGRRFNVRPSYRTFEFN